MLSLSYFILISSLCQRLFSLLFVLGFYFIFISYFILFYSYFRLNSIFNLLIIYCIFIYIMILFYFILLILLYSHFSFQLLSQSLFLSLLSFPPLSSSMFILFVSLFYLSLDVLFYGMVVHLISFIFIFDFISHACVNAHAGPRELPDHCRKGPTGCRIGCPNVDGNISAACRRDA